ncbi:tRNA nucleotidyltransferase/poly(A) polymerase [Mucisphaera calidilacus]|uniref:tRNA nucleotidyltransferase/poly(A) polymerase n=1 Tax=Mucisphaera calidilacus TaxID=2527982 RepID=A0A518BUN3_9BACT|nr:tRNA nucleotidyltransferase/poly(A) polymerase [Mucisphaera calidilacus]
MRIIQILRDAGHTAYFAGGCVRDQLLGIQPLDYDIATDAQPKTVQKLFPRCQMVGAAFGVALVRLGGHAIEVATFRREEGYSDRRRPDRVVFTNAREDAQRRDFTVNGLFADPLTIDPETNHDRVIDYVGGIDDLNNQCLRAIGEPDERFGEDYLRMLRAVRFTARLDFHLEPRTAASVRSLAKYLGQISRERIGSEVLAMLAHPRRAHAVTLLEELRLDGPVLNEDHLEPAQTTAPLNNLPHNPQPPVTLAAWWLTRQRIPMQLDAIAPLCERHADDVADRWRKALCLSNTLETTLRATLKLVPRAAQWGNLRIAQRKRLLAEKAWPHTWTLLNAIDDTAATQPIADDLPTLTAQGVAPEPLVRGEDILEAGMRPGPEVGKLLEIAYDEQLEGRIHDHATAQAWIQAHVSTAQDPA